MRITGKGMVLLVLSFFCGGPGLRLLDAQTVSLLHSFSGAAGPNGSQAGLIQASDGFFYGVSNGGGESQQGTVFRIDSAGDLLTLHSFTGLEGTAPVGSLIQASDGSIYGTTSWGGATGVGAIFKTDTSGNLTSLYSFSGPDGSDPEAGLVQGNDGKFYGTTDSGGANNQGSIFSFDGVSNLTTLYSFAGSDGANPHGALVQAPDGFFYGTTQFGGAGGLGTVFRIDTAGNFTSLYSFSGSDGSYPSSELIVGNDGKLYGTTLGGGGTPTTAGTVFEIDMLGNLTTLHSFTTAEGYHPFAGLVQAADGNFYGTTWLGSPQGWGTIFRLDQGGTLTTLHQFLTSDGYQTWSRLLQGSDGKLYGTANAGGIYGEGTIFSIDTGGTFTVIRPLGSTEGITPSELVQASDGNFYGTTAGGGNAGDGTVFRMDGFHVVTPIHEFAGAFDGAAPSAGLTQGTDGELYGTTTAGGANNLGTIFKTDLAGNVTTLRSFSGSNGADPTGRLIQATDGNFFGTTQQGGSSTACGTSGCGTVFKLDGSYTLTTLHTFSSTDGAFPVAGLVIGADGNFYGTTSAGGTTGYGTVFKIDAAGNFTTLHDFGGYAFDGVYPRAGLIQASDGRFYGTTTGGGEGISASGTIFRMDSSGQVTIVYTFTGYNDGADPSGGLIQALDGSFYGTTELGGPWDMGSTFRLDPAGNLTVFHLFGSVPSDAAFSRVDLIQGNDGNLYGATFGGGPAGEGTLFEITPCLSYPAPVISTSLCVSPNTSGLTASVPAVSGASYTWIVNGVTVASGPGIDTITFGSGAAGTSVGIEVSEGETSGCYGGTSATVQVDFSDVPASNPFYTFICTIARHGVTAGCGSGNFCPVNDVLRSQMAVFILRGEHGSTYVPPPATGIFEDVPASNPFAPWIEELYNEQITGGCSTNPLIYCPTNPVSRAGMAVFLLVGEHGTGYLPPACTGIFADVACPGAFTNWIEELYNEGITGGCNINPLIYCPNNSVIRAQMAVFLTVTFSLP